MNETWSTLLQFDSNANIEIEADPEISSDGDATMSRVERMLRQQSSGSHSTTDNNNVNRQIEMLCHTNRINADSHILKYWSAKKYVDVQMYKLSQVVLAAPASQVSVERAFSALGLVLTQRRNSLKSNNLSNILMVKLNAKLLEKMDDIYQN